MFKYVIFSRKDGLQTRRESSSHTSDGSHGGPRCQDGSLELVQIFVPQFADFTLNMYLDIKSRGDKFGGGGSHKSSGQDTLPAIHFCVTLAVYVRAESFETQNSHEENCRETTASIS